jgi:ribosomal protein S18 acetylase RimI-like enzyme
MKARDTERVADRLRRSDLRPAVATMVRAFWRYTETVHLLPNESRRRRVLPRYLLSDARDAAKFDLLLGDRTPNGIAGAAAWIPPEAYPVSLGRQFRQALDLAPALPWGMSALGEAKRGRAINRREHRKYGSHYYLRAIGVDPDAQARGIGTSLVVPVLAMADARGVGCFLQTATSENVSWYERFGFRVVSTYRPTPTWPDVWALWRDPTRSRARLERHALAALPQDH